MDFYSKLFFQVLLIGMLTACCPSLTEPRPRQVNQEELLFNSSKNSSKTDSASVSGKATTQLSSNANLIASSHASSTSLSTTSSTTSSTLGKPVFTEISHIPDRKHAFYEYFLPLILNANKDILYERKTLFSIEQRLDKNKKLSVKDQAVLNGLQQKYRVKADQNWKTVIPLLKVKIDVVPPSLAIAQSANESAWGTSRFALEANNYFGQWCYSKGCGLIPKQRGQGQNHEVAKFNHPQASVKSYMLNLNRHNSYANFRKKRAELRIEGKKIDGLSLVDTLMFYSQRRQAYIDELTSMIKYNRLYLMDVNLASPHKQTL